MGSGTGWNLWVWLMGMVLRRYVYRFPHNTYPYSSCICSFLQHHLYFLLTLGSVCMRAVRITVVVLCVCMCVCIVCLSTHIPPHTLESQKRDINGFIAIQRLF